MFPTMYSISNKKIKSQDLSRETEVTFIEIEPYAFDKDKNKFLNESKFPILKENGVVNIQEQIQSYASSCDIYELIARVVYSQDYSLLNQREGMYADISNIPNNINDQATFNNMLNNALDNVLTKNKEQDINKDVDITNDQIIEKLKNIILSDTTVEVKNESTK